MVFKSFLIVQSLSLWFFFSFPNIGNFHDMFRYLIVFITFIILPVVGALLYLKIGTEPEPNQPKGVGDSISSTAINGSASDNLSRVALVMGNGNYHHAHIGKSIFKSLRNPVNDAIDMAKVLKKLGFEVFLKT